MKILKTDIIHSTYPAYYIRRRCDWMCKSNISHSCYWGVFHAVAGAVYRQYDWGVTMIIAQHLHENTSN